MHSARTVIAIAVIALSAATASAQTGLSPFNSEAVIYRGLDFSGPALSVSAEQEDLGLAWSVNSLRLVTGRMEVCSAPRFRGTCRIVTQDFSDLTPLGLPGNRVMSMRPVAAEASFADPGLSAHGPTLQGSAAQFYATPMEFGRRVHACARAAASPECARLHAQAFCERRGYERAAYQSAQGIDGVTYLADVLCSP